MTLQPYQIPEWNLSSVQTDRHVRCVYNFIEMFEMLCLHFSATAFWFGNAEARGTQFFGYVVNSLPGLPKLGVGTLWWSGEKTLSPTSNWWIHAFLSYVRLEACFATSSVNLTNSSAYLIWQKRLVASVSEYIGVGLVPWAVNRTTMDFNIETEFIIWEKTFPIIFWCVGVRSHILNHETVHSFSCRITPRSIRHDLLVFNLHKI